MQVKPYAHPYYSDSGDIGVLFVHGFTSSPWSLLEWAQVTAANGYRVSLPRLPGHGTYWRELQTTGWQDWYACAEREFLTLTKKCKQVYVAGLSLGGALALRLAERHTGLVSGLLLVNPAIEAYPPAFMAPALSLIVPTTKSIGSDIAKPGVDEHTYERTPLQSIASMLKMWTDVRACLDLVTCPVLLFRSRNDHVVPASSSQTILTQISSEEITETLLEHSFHVATMDYDKEIIFADSLGFLAHHTNS